MGMPQPTNGGKVIEDKVPLKMPLLSPALTGFGGMSIVPLIIPVPLPVTTGFGCIGIDPASWPKLLVLTCGLGIPGIDPASWPTPSVDPVRFAMMRYALQKQSHLALFWYYA